jgi:hypothetical protein
VILPISLKIGQLSGRHQGAGPAWKVQINIVRQEDGREDMQAIHERCGRTPVQKEIGMVLKKAYCGFERLEKEHEEKMKALLEGLRGGRTGSRAA